MLANRDELSNAIRYQLSQLTAKNAHHEFEHLVRHFARIRISERIIPATGPVGAGGDGGRDFDTYRSYLANSPLAGSTFLANAADKTLVFACSLVKKIPSKIKSDLKTIFSCGGSIDAVYFFCEAKVPIGERQKLQRHCRETYNAELTIFDGVAIAEALIEPEVFWIAQRYLGLSADQYPRQMGSNDEYERYRTRWLMAGADPSSFADFAEIKAGLRLSTQRKNLRQDLLDWTRQIEKFLHGPIEALRKPAGYEICVSALRGLNDLTSRRSLVEEYFADVAKINGIGELRDACVLLTYCSSAHFYRHFEFDATKLHQYAASLARNLDDRLSSNPGPGFKCELLQLRGMVEGTFYRTGTSPSINASAIFGYWKRMLREVPNAPLFPLETFADVLTAIAPAFEADESFDSLTQKTDALLEKRSSSWVAAEKCRDRAIAFFDREKYLAAIRQLHIARVKWFSAETLRGSLLSMLLLSDCYLRLGLIYPAKYYSMVVAHLASIEMDSDVNHFAASAMRSFFAASFLGGEWFTCAAIAKYVFGFHNALESEPYNFEKYVQLEQVTHWAGIIRVISAKEDSQTYRQIERLSDEWPISPALKSEMDAGIADAVNTWDATRMESLRKNLFAELWARPFMDLGPYRTVKWRALGILWSVKFENERETVGLCEDLLSTLQITLADLASTDLVLLPTRVTICAKIFPQEVFELKQSPSNDEAIWDLSFPMAWLRSNRVDSEIRPAVLAIASQVLGECSALSQEEFMKRLSESMKTGLFGKTHVAKSYSQLFLQTLDKDDFQRNVRERLTPIYSNYVFEYRESANLAWPSDDGPGYSRALSEKHITNRYRRTVSVLKYSFPRLISYDVVREKFVALRERGLKDWEILNLVANIVVAYRAAADSTEQLRVPDPKKFMSWMNREEALSDSPIPISEFTDERIEIQRAISIAAMANTWHLHFHRRTPHLAAMEKLLIVRFHIREDDVPHSDIFEAAGNSIDCTFYEGIANTQ